MKIKWRKTKIQSEYNRPTDKT